jgi:hypothetical protein
MFRGSVKFKNEVHIIVYLVILQSLLCLFPQFQMHNWDRHTQQLTESSLYFSYLWSEGSYGRKSKMQVTIALSNWKTFGKLIATQNSWWNCRYLCHHQRLKGWKEWWFLAQIKFHYLRKFAHPLVPEAVITYQMLSTLSRFLCPQKIVCFHLEWPVIHLKVIQLPIPMI